MDTATRPRTQTGNHTTPHSMPWQHHRTTISNQPQVSISQGLSCKGAAPAHPKLPHKGSSKLRVLCNMTASPTQAVGGHSYTTKHSTNLSMAFLPVVHYSYQLSTQRYHAKTHSHLSCGFSCMCNQYTQIIIP